jgi:uncharacterized protein (DUF302 family)
MSDLASPAGTAHTDGVISKRSPFGVAESVSRLTEVIQAAGAKVFAVIDQSDEARQAGQSLRETRLVIFGNPAAGTQIMVASPLAALDLPLRILVFADDKGVVWMTYLDRNWLADRYGLPYQLATPLAAPGVLVSKVAANSY